MDLEIHAKLQEAEAYIQRQAEYIENLERLVSWSASRLEPLKKEYVMKELVKISTIKGYTFSE